MSPARVSQLIAIALVFGAIAGCTSHSDPKVPPPNPPPPVVDLPSPTTAGRTGGAGTSTGTEPVTPLPPVAPPVSTDPLNTMSIDDVNRAAALKPVFFVLDGDALDDAARQVLADNSQVLKKYGNWIVTIEGHCDERGSAEYNLALGDRRAQAVRNYLVSLGISADRVRTVSYGKEFPFDPGHDESAWTKNRRAQFMVTAK
jgi:peptidoglycan-associated lipoprotein